MLLPNFIFFIIVLAISVLSNFCLKSSCTNFNISSKLSKLVSLALALILIYEKKLVIVVDSKYFFKLTGIHIFIGLFSFLFLFFSIYS